MNKRKNRDQDQENKNEKKIKLNDSEDSSSDDSNDYSSSDSEKQNCILDQGVSDNSEEESESESESESEKEKESEESENEKERELEIKNQNEKIMEVNKDYLNVKKVKKFLKENKNEIKNNCIETRIYDRLIFKVIPNPLNKAKVEGCKQTYNSGGFVSFKTVYLPLSFIEDSKNYNS